MTRFLSADLWDEVRQLAAKPGPAVVAVAYTSCVDAVPFRRGDTLVTDASEQAIRTGQTNAATLHALHRKGVAVFSVENLHAKVFVFDGVAAIGSANLSVSSQSLVEAAVLTDDVKTVKAAADWIGQLCETAERLTLKKLAVLEAIPVTRRRGDSSRVLPTLAEALRDNSPVLRSYLFGMHARGADLTDRRVTKQVKAARLLPEGVGSGDWTWVEWHEEAGLKQRIEASFTRRPMIHFQMTQNDEGDYVAFRYQQPQATEFITSHRINTNGNAYRITVERILSSTPGLKLRGQSRRELVRVLNAGLEAEPKFVTRLNRDKLALVSPDLLVAIYRAGLANATADS